MRRRSADFPMATDICGEPVRERLVYTQDLKVLSNVATGTRFKP
jgi:hypothetical protein